MQAVRKHTAIIKMRGRSNYSRPGSFRVYFIGIDAPFGTLKFGHVEIRALGGNGASVRLPQRLAAGGRHRLIGRRDTVLEVDTVAG